MAQADTSYNIFKAGDKKIVTSLIKIAEEINVSNAKLLIRMANNYQQIQIPISEIDENESLKSIYNMKSALIHQIQITLDPRLQHGSITIQRTQPFDKVNIQFEQNVDPEIVTKLLAAAHKYLKPFSPTPELDKILGKELAEFYHKREETLVRLEDLETKVLAQNLEYRKKIDEEKTEYERRLREETDDKKGGLEERYKKKIDDLDVRSEAFEKLKKEFDDRSSKHARRQTRTEMLKKLSEHSEKFGLTEDTKKKRTPIHALFILLILAAGTLFGSNIYTIVIDPKLMGNWLFLGRITMSAIALGAAIVYYIRWNDSWFRRHSDEEFRLKRFALDIDRVNLVTEMALEFKDEEHLDVPSELIDRFTQGLFIESERTKSAKHPSEDLISALIGASAGLRLKVPGFGEITLDQKGIKTFKKALSRKDNDESEVA